MIAIPGSGKENLSGSHAERRYAAARRLLPEPLLRVAYRHVRHGYQAVANRGFAEDRRALRTLLRSFVAPGDLVFDIGANKGDYTDVLLSLGARVVAVEPNPTLAAFVAARYPVAVVAAAVGAAAGMSELHMGRDPGHSTISASWLQHAPGTARWSGATTSVPVTTLDALIADHGSPAFVKVDVEGYEAEVMRGCTRAISALSFEYQCAALGVAEECLTLLEEYTFNSLSADDRDFSEPWVGHNEILERLFAHRTTDPAGYGDVYARRAP